MSWVSIGNIIEAFFMLGVSLFFVVPLCRRGEKHRWFCFYGAMVFFSSAGSDFFEAYTGAWWEPRWLIVWNALTGIGVAGIVLWYIHIRGSFQAVIDEFNKPVSHFIPQKRKATQTDNPMITDDKESGYKPSRHRSHLLALSIIFIFLTLLFGFGFSGTGKGWLHRTFFTPEVIKDSRIVPVAEQLDRQNLQKKTFCETLNGKNGLYGLVFHKHTLEGDPLEIIILSDDGQARIIIDYTRDRYSNRDYKQLTPLAIKLGHKDDKGNFTESTDSLPQGCNYILKIDLPDETMYL